MKQIAKIMVVGAVSVLLMGCGQDNTKQPEVKVVVTPQPAVQAPAAQEPAAQEPAAAKEAAPATPAADDAAVKDANQAE